MSAKKDMGEGMDNVKQIQYTLFYFQSCMNLILHIWNT